jgi:TonB family protein
MFVLLAWPAISSAEGEPPLTTRDVTLKSKDYGLQRFFPEEALRHNIRGLATILCTVSQDGSLTDCSIACESPTGHWFGEATLRMAPYLRLEPTAKDGSATAGRAFIFPMFYNIAGKRVSEDQQKRCSRWPPE